MIRGNPGDYNPLIQR